MTVFRRGDVGECREGLSGLHKSSCDGHLFKIPGAGLDNGGWELDLSGRETLEGAKYLGMDGKDTDTGGRQTTGIRDVFQCGGADGTPIKVGDVGEYPPHGQVPG